MEGDLSLSQALGGLRVANPDTDSLPSSHESTPDVKTTIPVRNSSNRATSRKPLSHVSSLRTPPASSPLALNQSIPSPHLNQANTSDMTPFPALEEQQPALGAGRQSIPAEYALLQHQRQQYRAPSGTSILSEDQTLGRSYGSQNYGSPRPISSIYPQLSSSVSPGASAGVNGGSYRLRSESSRSSMNTYPSTSDSRGGSAALQAGVPSHESSYTDRTYRQSQSGVMGNAPMPHRKSSRGISGVSGAPPNGLSATPSAAEAPPPTTAEEWQERGATTVVRHEVDRNGQVVLKSTKKGVRDFAFGRTLGQGSYSTVLAATDRQTLQDYAVKVLDKRHIIKEKKVKYVNIEKDTLNRLTSHPGIVRLYYTFQDEKSLYYVLDLAANGELLETLKHTKTFNVECTRFYGAQILDAIDYMHRQGVIHRDLKPENVLLDKEMHVKITDFGTAKILDTSRPRENGNSPYIPFSNDSRSERNNDRANSFVGTAEYVSPELLTDKSACKASDLWAFGCIVFQLLAGRPPFKRSWLWTTIFLVDSLQLLETWSKGC
jgi:3-phosphoinositide dependent protein kinase-1